MTKEELIDLCARVPYHPKGHVVNAHNGAECDEWLTCATFEMFTIITNNCRLYLRSLSSMTAVEVGDYISLKEDVVGSDGITYFFETHESIDWLNAHHFDYRGLIEKGLALEASEGMYNIK
jgi:hypothetical protein